ncbi:MAG: hypothetical protein ABFS42_02080 [Candidatus Krumholzibacteriota bacterium]
MSLICGALASPGSGSIRNRPRRRAGTVVGAMTILALGLVTQGLLVSPATAKRVMLIAAESDSVELVEVEKLKESNSSCRDSLMIEIRKYSRMVATMKDSLEFGGGDIELSEEQRLVIEENIADISEVIENIGVELSQLEFEIKDNTISLVNESGEGIIINIPENLDEHLSEGLEILSHVILSELPDSIDFDQTRGWDWSGFVPHAPPPPRKVVHGNLIKVWDDLHVPAEEDVRGDVVVVFGNTEISGRVDGNVVVVFGNLLLDDASEVTGKIVSVGGRLDKDPDAETGDVVSVDLWPGERGGPMAGWFGQGILPFLMCQGTFLLTVLLAVIAVVAAPPKRFGIIVATLQESSGPSLGLGLVTAVVGHLMVLVLIAVLILTVIGVPLALLVFLALVIVIILSVAVSGAVLGNRICALLGTGCSRPWFNVILGMSILHLVSFAGSVTSLSSDLAGMANALVVAGIFIKSLAFLFGLGALVVSRFGSRQPA